MSETAVSENDLEVLGDKLSDRVNRRKDLHSLIVTTAAEVQGQSSRTIELNRQLRTPRLIHRRKGFKAELSTAVSDLSRTGTHLSAQRRVLEAEDTAIINLSQEFRRAFSLHHSSRSPEDQLRSLLGDSFSLESLEASLRGFSPPGRREGSSKEIDELAVDIVLAEELYDVFSSLGYWISREVLPPLGVTSLFKVVLETAQEFRLAVALASPQASA